MEAQSERGKGGEKPDLAGTKDHRGETWELTEDLTDPDPPTSRTPRSEQIWR
jgi:hypothetical protein